MPLRLPLPKDTTSDGSVGLRCPWCDACADDATVRLEDLMDTWSFGALEYAPRDQNGAAGEGALVCDCPHCRRPFAIALQRQNFDGQKWREVRLLAIRTPADVAFLHGEGAW